MPLKSSSMRVHGPVKGAKMNKLHAQIANKASQLAKLKKKPRH